MRRKTQQAKEAGIPLAALWVQDWEGKRITSFGKQLFWDWCYSKQMYPDLPELISELRHTDIRFLGYINPFLATDGSLYKEASAKGYCIKDANNNDYLITVTTFPAALLDISNPQAAAWIKTVIQENMLGIGLSGWMADFGEYLPTDAVLHNGNALEYHNRYPVEWARLNYEAITAAGRLQDVAIFMRAGFSGTSRYAHSIWAGDQMVDWSRHDGLPSVIPAALSAGVSGIGVHHSDIGGYTTLYHVKRSKELFFRWAEQAAFTCIMRTHEGNRPDKNWQWDTDSETIQHLAAMTQVFTALRPYRRAVLAEYYSRGIPAIRPVCMHYLEKAEEQRKPYSYLLGRDVFVQPVTKKGRYHAHVTLPRDNWVHMWTGKRFTGGGCTHYSSAWQAPCVLPCRQRICRAFCASGQGT